MYWLLGMRDYFGYAAGALTTVAFVPQVLKAVKQRRTEDISLGMYLLFCSGVALWFVYGVLIAAAPVVIFNFITLLLAGTVLALKIKNG